jgi:hypothetical protein
MFPKHENQIQLNVEHTLAAIAATESAAAG